MALVGGELEMLVSEQDALTTRPPALFIYFFFFCFLVIIEVCAL